MSTEPPKICGTCHRPLAELGPDGACVHCLVAFVSPPEGGLEHEPFGSESGTSGTRQYEHFEISPSAECLSAELGRGAMGTTYRAQDTVLHRVVALKVIKRSVAEHPDARARFLREARAAAQFQHPNVATVSHYGEQDGECFYAMELVVGETLEARVRRDGPLPVETALGIATQVALALAAAEAHGIVHRDLKPSNIMLASNGGNAAKHEVPLVKVIDFGLAKAVGMPAVGGLLDTRGVFVGTPAFASPEQFARTEDGSIDTRSDIYSLGITLWYLLCGKLPFVGRTLTEIHEQQTGQPLPLDQLRAARVPGCVVSLLRNMLAVSPAARPQSARELLAALERTRRALPPPRHVVRRRRFALLAVALALLALTGAWWYRVTRPPPPPPDRSLAVLPFENLSPRPEDAFYATGIQDEITANLARVAMLKVVTPDTADHYPVGKRDFAKIGSDLGVKYLLAGSVRCDGAEAKVQTTVQLIDTAAPQTPWEVVYERSPSEVFLAQSEITRAITDHLQARLSHEEKAAIDVPPTTDLMAYDLFLRAMDGPQLVSGPDEERQEGNRQLALLEQAIKRDPNFVRAYCEMAKIQDMFYMAHVDVTPADRALDRRALAESALQKARRLRPDAGEVHLAAASHLLFAVEDTEQAQAEIASARRTLPNDPEVEVYAGVIAETRHHFDEAMSAYTRATVLAPRRTVAYSLLAVTCRRLRRYEDADHALAQLIILQAGGKDAIESRITRATAIAECSADLAPLREVFASPETSAAPMANLHALLLGYFSRDADAMAKALATIPKKQFGVFGIDYPRAWFEALAARIRGDEAQAQVAFAAARVDVEKSVSEDPRRTNGETFSLLALIDAGLGRKDDAIREGRQAFDMMRSKGIESRTYVSIALAQVYAWTGQADLAFAQLEPCLTRPAARGLVYEPTYGDFVLNPVWDPLRADPRFALLLKRIALPASTADLEK